MTVPHPNPSHSVFDPRHDALPLLSNGDQTSVSNPPAQGGSSLRDNLLSSSLKETMSQLGVSYTHPLRRDGSGSEDDATLEPSNLSYDAMSSSFSLSDALQGVQRINTQSGGVPLHNNIKRGEDNQSSLDHQQDRNMKQPSGSGTSTPVSLAPLVSLRSRIERNDLNHNDDIDYALLSHLTGNEQLSRGYQSTVDTSIFNDTNSLDFN